MIMFVLRITIVPTIIRESGASSMVWMRVVWEVVMLLRTDNRCETVLGGKEGLGE